MSADVQTETELDVKESDGSAIATAQSVDGECVDDDDAAAVDKTTTAITPTAVKTENEQRAAGDSGSGSDSGKSTTDIKSLSDSANVNDIQSLDESVEKNNTNAIIKDEKVTIATSFKADTADIGADAKESPKLTNFGEAKPEPQLVEVKPPGPNDYLDKLDELSSLEREIAEMHHVEPTTPALAKRVSQDDGLGADYSSDEKVVLLEMKPPRSFTAAPSSSSPTSSPLSMTSSSASPQDAHKTPVRLERTAAAIIDSVEDTLEHDELIAVLKGIDQSTSASASAAATASTVAEGELGVTIEGEGEFQIMEIFDDEPEQAAAKSAEKKCEPIEEPAALKPTVTMSSNAAKKVVAVRKTHSLTPEEARAVAMEQMAGLKTRRRKQDNKAPKVEKPATATKPAGDLVSSLGADWTDDEDDGESKTAVKKEPSHKKPKSNGPIVTDVQILLPARPLAQDRSAPDEGSKSRLTRGNSRERSAAADRREPRSATPAGLPVSTGFTRTRIIKRKIIWDPDEHVPQNTYARNARAKALPPTPATAKKARPTLNKDVAKKPIEPEAEKKAPVKSKGGKVTSTTSAAAAAKAKSQASAANNNNNAAAKATPMDASSSNTAATAAAVPVKRRSDTPVTNGTSSVPAVGAGVTGKKKKVSEIDRLMGDEGAANMLNALEERRNQNETDTHRPLMRSRTATNVAAINNEKAQPTKSTAVATAGATKKDTTASNSLATMPSTSSSNAASPTEVVPSSSATAMKGKRQPNKQKPSSTWDYVYKQQRVQEDSMIIRRRSNSSYSSSASMRLSLDAADEITVQPDTAAHDAKATTSTSAANSNAKTSTGAPAGPATPAKPSMAYAKFEFAKPESKSSVTAASTFSPLEKQSPPTTSALAAKLAGRRSVKGVNTTGVGTGTGAAVKQPIFPDTDCDDIVVRQSDRVFHILFNTLDAEIRFTFTAHLLNKLATTLNMLANNDECSVVAMITYMPHFCQGIDFTALTLGNFEEREQAAYVLAAAVKNYMRALATFPKPLVVGVNGTNIGLGVTQLALFDLVVASDKCTFETPYAKYGQLAEGFCFWYNTTKLRAGYKTKLLWLCEKAHTTESVLGGLLNKIAPPDKVNEETLLAARRLASHSSESYRAMKQTAKMYGLAETLKIFDAEMKTIMQQWTSNECYDHFKKYLSSDIRY